MYKVIAKSRLLREMIKRDLGVKKLPLVDLYDIGPSKSCPGIFARIKGDVIIRRYSLSLFEKV